MNSASPNLLIALVSLYFVVKPYTFQVIVVVTKKILVLERKP